MALALGAVSCSCGDRVVGDEPEGDEEPACLWLINPRGVHPDGREPLILDPDGGAGTVCLCLTEEEYDGLGERLSRRGWPEPGTLLEEFNDLAYAECKRLASLEDFVDDECLAYYETGEWLKDIYWTRGNWADGAPPGFACH
ncbi:MAG: hypothetical protein KDK70_01605, partial [Myxococcales bacterium]|nr:hypothetical protein [Myxococcales bacterium]